MAILNQKRILNLIPKTSAPVTIHVSQGDVGTEIEFTLVKGDELFVNTGSLTASVHGVREDGANFGAFTCTLSGSGVKFPLHSEMTMVKGSAIAEIVLVDSQGNKVGSANFGIMVEESVFPLGVTYDNDVSVYESILAYVQTIPAQVTQDYNSKINALNAGLANEANTRAGADAALGARIDNIIAPSGEAPSAAEVTDARVGWNGKTYTSLGGATRAQSEDVKNGVVGLDSNSVFVLDIANSSSHKASDAVKSMYYVPIQSGSDIIYDADALKSIKWNSLLRIGTYSGAKTAVFNYTNADGVTTTIDVSTYDSSAHLFKKTLTKNGVSIGIIVVELQPSFDTTTNSDNWLFTPSGSYNVISQSYFEKQFEDDYFEFIDQYIGNIIFSKDVANANSHKASEAIKSFFIQSTDDSYWDTFKVVSILRVGMYNDYPNCIISISENGVVSNKQVISYQKGSNSWVYELSGGYLTIFAKDSFDPTVVNSNDWMFTPSGTYNIISDGYMKFVLAHKETEWEVKKLYTGNDLDYMPVSSMPSHNNSIYGDRVVKNNVRYMFDGEGYKVIKEHDIPCDEEHAYDVCILGGGNSGVAATYPFIGSTATVCLIEKNEHLGGTPCLSGVCAWEAGYVTPMLENIFESLHDDGEAFGVLANSWMRNKFSGSTASTNLLIRPDALTEKFESDLAQDNITILTNAEFVNYGRVLGDSIKFIYVKHNNKTIKISAKIFIDCTTDAALIRSINNKRDVDYLYGRDYKTDFNESLAIESGNKRYLNEPSFYFKIAPDVDDSEILNRITSVYRSGDTVVAPSYINGDGYEFYVDEDATFINPMYGVSIQGLFKLQNSEDYFYKVMRDRTLEYWKFNKLHMQIAYEQGNNYYYGHHVSYRNYGFVDFLPMIGNRETFRIVCEEMLTQNDLATLATNGDNVIAVNDHGIDMHVITGLNWSAVQDFNENTLKPYAIKYGSIIPKGLKNAFVPSKCYGASQIAYSSGRLNKVMNQLGYFAGNAALYFVRQALSDVRDVNLATVKGAEYTDFNNRFATWISKYNP